jgi:predicted dehydrogenase
MGRVHLENLVNLSLAGDIELVALGDRYGPVLEAALAAVSQKGGAELVQDLAQYGCPEVMATEAQLDGVVVASRTEDHVRDSRSFTDRGIPVMMEKPFANSVAEAVEYTRVLGDAGGRLIQVGLQRHYDPAGQTAMRWVSEGLIGDLQQTHHVLQDKNPTPAAYQSTGITADMAIHLVYEAMSFRAFEMPVRVQAVRFLVPHYEDRAGEGANVVHVFCSWADNSLAHLWGSRINPTGYDNGFKLMGTGGRIDVGEFVGDFGEVSAKLWRGTGLDEIARGTLSEYRQFPMTRPGPEHPDFYARYATAYCRELAAFCRHIESNEFFEIGPEVGWKTLLVAQTAEASSRSGGEAFLLEEDGAPIATVDGAAKFARKIDLD